MPLVWKLPKLSDTAFVPLKFCGKGPMRDLGKGT